MVNEEDLIIIHKYASRRLYNTSTSQYLIIEDIAELIKNGKKIKIVDKETDKDCTNQYLLQIISNFEDKPGYNLPKNLLFEIIRGYSSATQNIFPELMNSTFELFTNYQDKFMASLNSGQGVASSGSASSDMIGSWQAAQKKMFDDAYKNWFNGVNTDQTPQPEVTKSEVDDLKRQIDEITKILRN